jgi:hypothetical protein
MYWSIPLGLVRAAFTFDPSPAKELRRRRGRLMRFLRQTTDFGKNNGVSDESDYQ